MSVTTSYFTWLEEREALAFQRDKLRQEAHAVIVPAVTAWVEARTEIEPLSNSRVFTLGELIVVDVKRNGLPEAKGLESISVSSFNGQVLSISIPSERGVIAVNGGAQPFTKVKATPLAHGAEKVELLVADWVDLDLSILQGFIELVIGRRA